MDTKADSHSVPKRKVKTRSITQQKLLKEAGTKQGNASSIASNLRKSEPLFAGSALSADSLTKNRLQHTQDVDALLAATVDPEEQVVLAQKLHRDDDELFGDFAQPSMLDLTEVHQTTEDTTKWSDTASLFASHATAPSMYAYTEPIAVAPPPLVIPHYAPHTPRPPLPLLSQALARAAHMQHLFRHAYDAAVPHAADLVLPQTARALEAWVSWGVILHLTDILKP